MGEDEIPKLTRAELMIVSHSIGGGPGPTDRRIDSREPEIIPIWGSLADFGGRFFFLQNLAPGLPPTPAGNFDSEGKALDWLAEAINANLPEVCRAFRRVQSERLNMAAGRAKEIADQAVRNAEMTAKRARDSEVVGGG